MCAICKDLMSEQLGSGQERIGEEFHHLMGLALQEARAAYGKGEIPVGAVLVTGEGTVLSRAHNSPIALSDPTAHAEILALRQAASALGNYRLPGSTLYVTLEPCAMCMGAILQARVRKLVFGAADPKSGAAGSVVDLTKPALFNHYVEVVQGVRAQECAKLLKSFFEERRQKKREGIGGEVPKWP
jgi:tRNA(adenine34) deaminase